MGIRRLEDRVTSCQLEDAAIRVVKLERSDGTKRTMPPIRTAPIAEPINSIESTQPSVSGVILSSLTMPGAATPIEEDVESVDDYDTRDGQ
jgi:hypothetical protein